MGKLLATLLLLTHEARPQAALPTIDPTWVYITPLRWVHAVPAAGIDERTTYATVLVLYPEGRFVQLSAGLIEHGREKAVTFSNFQGLEIRRGTWVRTDSDRIRIQSRLTEKVDRSPDRLLAPIHIPPDGPLVTETCALEGRSKTHLAQTIHCPHLLASPVHIPLSYADLQNLTAPLP